jgi:hypothetical protein
VRSLDFDIPDTDCDTGRPASGGEYPLADKTYARLLHDLSKNKLAQLTPDLRGNILSFYSNFNGPVPSKKEKAEKGVSKKELKAWEQTKRELDELKKWTGPTDPSERADNGANKPADDSDKK